MNHGDVVVGGEDDLIEPHRLQVECLLAQEITRVGFVNNLFILKSSTEYEYN